MPGYDAQSALKQTIWRTWRSSTLEISSLAPAAHELGKPNVVFNGTFEGAAVTGWAESGSSGTAATFAASAAQKHSGGQSMLVTSVITGNIRRVTQAGAFRLVTGQQYFGSIWFWTAAITDAPEIRIGDNSTVFNFAYGQHAITGGEASSSWVEYPFSFVATGQGLNVCLLFNTANAAGGNLVYLDDIRIYPASLSPAMTRNLLVYSESDVFYKWDKNPWTTDSMDTIEQMLKASTPYVLPVPIQWDTLPGSETVPVIHFKQIATVATKTLRITEV